MHTTIKSCIAAIDAGRQALFPSRSSPNLSYPAQFAHFMPVPEPPVKKAARNIRRKMKAVRRSTRSTLKNVIEAAKSANPIIRKSRAEAAQRLAELTLAHETACLVAFANESEKNRLIQKESMMKHWSSAQFDRVFPPSLNFVSNAWAKETSDRIWEELVSASERTERK